MDIIPIEINFNTLNNLYENRHLCTDDFQYFHRQIIQLSY